MKRTFIFFLGLLCFSFNCVADEAAKCALQHNGNVTIYNGSDILNALSTAVDGDTLFLTKGTFDGFTLDKRITVRGAGQETITGEINVNISGIAKLTNTLLEGLNINGNITLSSEMDGVKIKKCSFARFDVDNSNKGILIDRCLISGILYQGSNIKEMTVTNSKIKVIMGSSSKVETCSFINDIIDGFDSYWSYCGTLLDCTFTNTLLGFNPSLDSSTSSKNNCYQDTKMSIDTFESNFLECSYDSSQLQDKGYLGNDKTIVGIYGGSTPYTLELAVPKVTDSQISYNASKKVLNVSLKVSAK